MRVERVGDNGKKSEQEYNNKKVEIEGKSGSREAEETGRRNGKG